MNAVLVTEHRTMQSSQIRELYEQYEGALEAWQIKLAIARLQRYRIPHSVWEDTMQDLAIEIHQFQFDPDKAHAASEETIVCRMMDNRIRMLAREHARRLACLHRLSQLRQQTEDDQRPEDELMRAEVVEVVAELPEELQATCRALMDGQSAYQIAQRTGMHYDVVQRQIRQIRNVFLERGLDPCQE